MSHPSALVSWLDPRDLPASAAALLAPDDLAPDEREAGTGTDRRRTQRQTAGVLLRCLVASVWGDRPQQVAVRRHCPHCPAPHGRPELPGSAIRVSVSHAGDRVAVAVSPHCAVGIDVETARVPSPALLRRALTANEQQYLRRISQPRRTREFLRAWTAKEAILKATGQGLHGGPARLDLDLHSRPLRLLSWSGSTARARTVRLIELDPGAGHVATLAAIGVEALSISFVDGRALVERMLDENSARMAAPVGRPAW